MDAARNPAAGSRDAGRASGTDAAEPGLAGIAALVRETLSLLGPQTRSSAPSLIGPAGPADGLLAQCLQLLEDRRTGAVEPIRLLHHFACTGGTLVARCVAAMPNVQLLSEVDPLSTIPHEARKSGFKPTDMIGLLRRSSIGADEGVIRRLFESDIRIVHDDCIARGMRLVLRDHAHSHFCVGAAIPARPTLREMLPPTIPTRSVVTVRHPVDSFASLVVQHERARGGWLHFEPATLHEYALRYLAFLDRHADVPLVRYEDFTARPAAVMQGLCELLELPFQSEFDQLLGTAALSGDSGRRGDVIGPRPRRPEAVRLLAEARASDAAAALCARLGYDLDEH